MPEGTGRVPRWLPARAEALVVRRLAVRNRSSSSCSGSARPKPRFPSAGSRCRSIRIRLADHGPRSWVLPVSQLPNPKVRSCPTCPEPKLHPCRWRRANRSPAFRRAGPGPEGPVSGLVRFLPSPKAHPVPSGRFTKPAAFASAKGQARSFRLAAASSAALPSSTRLVVWWDKEVRSLWLWLGRLSPVAGRSSRPRVEAVMESESHQADSERFRLWITRITGITETVVKCSVGTT